MVYRTIVGGRIIVTLQGMTYEDLRDSGVYDLESADKKSAATCNVWKTSFD